MPTCRCSFLLAHLSTMRQGAASQHPTVSSFPGSITSSSPQSLHASDSKATGTAVAELREMLKEASSPEERAVVQKELAAAERGGSGVSCTREGRCMLGTVGQACVAAPDAAASQRSQALDGATLLLGGWHNKPGPRPPHMSRQRLCAPRLCRHGPAAQEAAKISSNYTPALLCSPFTQARTGSARSC